MMATNLQAIVKKAIILHTLSVQVESTRSGAQGRKVDRLDRASGSLIPGIPLNIPYSSPYFIPDESPFKSLDYGLLGLR